jgi:hypothetical protein
MVSTEHGSSNGEPEKQGATIDDLEGQYIPSRRSSQPSTPPAQGDGKPDDKSLAVRIGLLALLGFIGVCLLQSPAETAPSISNWHPAGHYWKSIAVVGTVVLIAIGLVILVGCIVAFMRLLRSTKESRNG